MPKPPRPSSELEAPPLVGRIVHALVIAGGVASVTWLGWTAGPNVTTKSALALVGGALFAFLWLGLFSPSDPEPRLFEWLAISGRPLLLIEVVLIIAGGAALWMAWHRAAGETYWTVAFIDLAVRYTRIAKLWNSGAASSGTGL